VKTDPDVAVTDPRVPGGARNVANKLSRSGWTVRLRHVEVPIDQPVGLWRPWSGQSVSVAAVKEGERRRFGIWIRTDRRDEETGQDVSRWVFDGGWILDRSARRVTSKELTS
jgi:hypothetical protein